MADFLAKMLGIEDADTGPMAAAVRQNPAPTDTDGFLTKIALTDPKLFEGLWTLRQMPPSKSASAAAKPAGTSPLDRIRTLIQGGVAKSPAGKVASTLGSAIK